MIRRRLWLGGAALAAAGAGLAVGGWRERRAAASPEAAFWSLRFDRPDGGDVTMAALRGRPLLLNFWATWCPPCVAELPLIDRFSRARPGWRVIGLAVDQPGPVRRFLALHPVSFPVGLAGLEGVDLARRLGNAGGGLPFSRVFASDGALRGAQLGALTANVLEGWGASVR